VRLHEKGGKRHEMPAHHKLEAFIDAYIDVAKIREDDKGPLFRTARGKTGELNGGLMNRVDAYRMIRRPTAEAGFKVKLGCHVFRATGITAYLEAGGTLENAQAMAAHESPRTSRAHQQDPERARPRVRPAAGVLLIDFRPLETPVGEALSSSYMLTIRGDRYEVIAGPDLPTLRLAVEGAEGPTFTADGGVRRERFYDIEAQRGYDSQGWLWSPGYFAGEIRKDCPLTLIAATEAWHTVLALSPTMR
jgi:hypothetical protein